MVVGAQYAAQSEDDAPAAGEARRNLRRGPFVTRRIGTVGGVAGRKLRQLHAEHLFVFVVRAEEGVALLHQRCDAFFGTDDEYEKVLGMQLPQFAARDAAYRPDTAGYERASAEVAARFPRCRSIVFGLRSVLSANHHLISGTLYTGGRLHSTRVYDIDPWSTASAWATPSWADCSTEWPRIPTTPSLRWTSEPRPAR